MNPYLFTSIDKGAIVIKKLLALVPNDRLDSRSHPEWFTVREIAAHLAEWEPIMRGRIEQAISNPGSSLVVYDEEQMAIEGDYGSRDPMEQAAIFLDQRILTAELIRSLTPEQLQSSVLHPERGVLSAEDLANLLLGHDLYHIEQLTDAIS